MTSLHKSFETDAAGKRTGNWGTVWSVIVSLFLRYQNRRAVFKLHDFNDHQLRDIGLTRDDLLYASRGNLFDDHSMDLTRAALRRRARLNVI